MTVSLPSDPVTWRVGDAFHESVHDVRGEYHWRDEPEQLNHPVAREKKISIRTGGSRKRSEERVISLHGGEMQICSKNLAFPRIHILPVQSLSSKQDASLLQSRVCLVYYGRLRCIDEQQRGYDCPHWSWTHLQTTTKTKAYSFLK